MKCGRCASTKQTIIWTRPGAINTILRRRLCETCERAWTTREHIIQTSVRDLAETDFVAKRMLAKWRAKLLESRKRRR